jgi:hypothetical protein
MAPKKLVEAQAGAEQRQQDPREESQEEDQDISIGEIQQMLEDSNLNSPFVRIMRRAPGGSDFDYCATLAVTAFDFDVIKETYGGGQYQIVFLDSNKKYIKRRQFAIDPRIKGRLDKGGSEGADPARAASDSGTAVMKMMMDQQSESTKLLMTMMMESSKANAAMMTAAISGRSGGGAGLEIKDVIALLPFLIGKDKAERFGPKEMLELYREMRELTGDEGSDKGGLVDKIVEALPTLAAKIAGGLAGNQPARVLPAHERRVGPEPAPTRTAQPAAAPAEDTDLQRVLKLTLNAARRKGEVELYHDMVMEFIDDSNADSIKNVLTQDDWFGLLWGNVPDAEAVKPWTEKLRNLLLETLNEPAGDAPDNNGAEQGGKAEQEPSGGDSARLPA